MKRILSLFVVAILFACTLCLVGCSDDEALKNLETRIIALETALSEADDTITDYQDRIETLETELGKLKSSSKTYQNKVNDMANSLTKVTSDLENLAEASDTSIEVFLADQYYLVVNDTFQLYYRSVIRAVDPYGYYIHVTGDDGHPYNRYFEFKPTKAGTYNLQIDVCDDNGNILGTDSTKLIVSASKKTNATNRTVLCIGDSLTASGDWVYRAMSKYTAAGGKVTTVGSFVKNTYKYEGRSGWSWSSYLSKYDASTMSPFAPTGENPSIRDYCTRNGYGEITDFYILMTFNGLPGTYTTFTWDDSFIQSGKKLIDLIHSEYPNAKINLISLPLTSTKSGLGAYYTVNQTYSDNYGKAVTVMHYDNFLEDWCKSAEYKSFMRYIDAKGQFDSEYNMPYESKDINTTNSTVKEDVGNSMGLHPTQAGYYQIGDAVFRAMMND